MTERSLEGSLLVAISLHPDPGGHGPTKNAYGQGSYSHRFAPLAASIPHSSFAGSQY